MHLGVAYYPEHWPEDRWATDARLMREAGIRRARLAEFAWKRLEPREGRYDFDWLERAIRILEREKIGVILCTPTPPYPAWLHAKYPDIHQVHSNGQVKEYGQRQDACKNHPGYRKAARRVAERMVRRFGGDPAVVAWQTDNELGCHGTARCWCHNCEHSFRVWLRERYHGDVDRLNAAWGTVFWSQEYDDFAQICPPRDTADNPGLHGQNPGLVLDYLRFCSDTQVRFQKEQIDLIRAHSPGRPVTHNFMHYFYQVDYFDLARDLDVVSWDNYPYFMAGTGRPPEALPFNLMHGLKDANVWVMEQASGPGGWGTFSATPRPGEMRLWSYQAIARGADMVSYFRWRTARFGREQFWHGILHHHGRPGRRYDEVKRLGAELARLEPRLEGSRPAADVGLLFDFTSLWALEAHPQVAPAPPGEPTYGYHALSAQWLGALGGLGAGGAVLSVSGDLSRYRAVLAPTLHVVPDGLVPRLEAYVRGGGTLILGPRSGVKDPSSTVTDAVLPGALRALAGLTIADYDVFSARPDGRRTRAVRAEEHTFQAWSLAELLVPEDGATPLLTWTGGEEDYEGKPAAVIHRLGQGTCVYVGTVLDTPGITWLLRKCVPGLEDRTPLPAGLEVVRRAKGDGSWVTFYLNHTPVATRVSPVESGTDLLGGSLEGGELVLEPFGVAAIGAPSPGAP